MKKKLLILLLVLMSAFSLTACMEVNEDMKVSKEGIVTTQGIAYIDKKAYEDYMSKISAATNSSGGTIGKADMLKLSDDTRLETIDGKEYYVSEDKKTTEKIADVFPSPKNADNSFELNETGVRFKFTVAKFLGKNELSSQENTKMDALMKQMYDKSFFIFSVEFDYDIISKDSTAQVDPSNPKKATWKIPFSELSSSKVAYAYCHSDIKVSGVTSGKAYRKLVNIRYSGAKTVIYNGKKIKATGKNKVGKYGKNTIVMIAESGEKKTTCFYIDNKKPVIKGLKKKKMPTFSTITFSDKDSKIVSVKLNGKKHNCNSNYLILKKKGLNRIEIKDAVGNVKKIKVRVC